MPPRRRADRLSKSGGLTRQRFSRGTGWNIRKRIRLQIVRNPKKPSRLAAFLGRTSKGIRFAFDIFARAVVAVFLLSLLLYVYREVTHDVLIIDPFTVPKRFEEAGLSPEVMANRVGARIRQIETDAWKSPQIDVLAFKHDEESTPDVEIPGTKLGLKTVIEIARGVFGVHPRHIGGDVSLSLGVSKPAEAPSTKNPITATVYVAQGGDRSSTLSISVADGDADALVQRTAEGALEQIRPFTLAVYLRQEREYERGIEVVQRVAQGPPEGRRNEEVPLSDVFNLWALLLSDQGRDEDAIDEYQQAVQLDPRMAVFHSNLGMALAEEDRTDEAIAEFRKSIEVDPKYSYAYRDWGFALAGHGEFNEAIAKYQKSVELDPNDSEPLYGWGYALDREKRYDEALAKYERAVALAPKSPSSYEYWGGALLERKKYDEAIAKFQRAIEIDAKSERLYEDWGIALRRQKKYTEAAAKFQKAIDLDPEAPGPHESWGMALLAQKRYNEAIAQFKKATELYPRDAFAYSKWGKALLAQGRLSEAVARLQEATEANPFSAQAYSTWGELLIHQRKYDDAIAKFQQAIHLAPQFSAPYAGWARALAKEGKNAEAIRVREMAKDFPPSD
jgi:tetratricopeptide (TPR) repeat protein